MQIAFTVNYKNKDGEYRQQVFPQKAKATAFARKVSKQFSSRTTLYKCVGNYEGNTFCESSSYFVCWYVDGKKMVD